MPFTPAPGRSLQAHADSLAKALKKLSPDDPALKAYQASKNEEWVTGANLCKIIDIGERTLFRWRDSGALTPGTEWRRKSPGKASTCIYNVAAISQKMESREWSESKGLPVSDGLSA